MNDIVSFNLMLRAMKTVWTRQTMIMTIDLFALLALSYLRFFLQHLNISCISIFISF